MKINRTVLKKIINEELMRFILKEQNDTAASTDIKVELSPEAKASTEKTAASIKNSNAQTLAQLTTFRDQNPNLDHQETERAINQLQKIGGEIDLSLTSLSESEGEEEISEIIRKLSSGDYRVYSKKKNSKTGERRNLGTYSSKSGAKEREQDIHFFKSQK